jgi:hypothetical protein
MPTITPTQLDTIRALVSSANQWGAMPIGTWPADDRTVRLVFDLSPYDGNGSKKNWYRLHANTVYSMDGRTFRPRYADRCAAQDAVADTFDALLRQVKNALALRYAPDFDPDTLLSDPFILAD